MIEDGGTWEIPQIVWGELIADIHCSARTINALLRNRYLTVGQLNGLSPNQIIQIRNIGQRGIEELSIEIQKILNQGKSYFPMELEPKKFEPDAIPEDIEEALALARRSNPNSDNRLVFVVSARFGLLGQERLTLQQIADILSLSRERVRQVEKIGLRRLVSRRGVSDWGKVSTAPEWAKVLNSMDKMRG